MGLDSFPLHVGPDPLVGNWPQPGPPLGRRIRAISLLAVSVAIHCPQGTRDIKCPRVRNPNRQSRLVRPVRQSNPTRSRKGTKR
jgi:hypothetical protein